MLNERGGSEVKLRQDPARIPHPVCTACHETIKGKEKMFGLAVGSEKAQQDLGSCLLSTGMVWHVRCLDYMTLPGMEGRDDPLGEDGRGKYARSKINL